MRVLFLVLVSVCVVMGQEYGSAGFNNFGIGNSGFGSSGLSSMGYGNVGYGNFGLGMMNDKFQQSLLGNDQFQFNEVPVSSSLPVWSGVGSTAEWESSNVQSLPVFQQWMSSFPYHPSNLGSTKLTMQALPITNAELPVQTLPIMHTSLPLTSSKSTARIAQPIMANPVVQTYDIYQPIFQKHHVQQPIIQQRLIEQPILKQHYITQPIIRPVVTQPIIHPKLYENTVTTPRIVEQPIMQPKILEQTIITPKLVEQAMQNQPITDQLMKAGATGHVEAPLYTQIPMPVYAGKKSAGFGYGGF